MLAPGLSALDPGLPEDVTARSALSTAWRCFEKTLDDFMQDFRVEERHYFRENHSVNAQTKSMVLQERLYFRNIPLSNWVEHEMLEDPHGRRGVDELLDDAWADVPEQLRPAATVTLAAHLDKLAEEGRLPEGVSRPEFPAMG